MVNIETRLCGVGLSGERRLLELGWRCRLTDDGCRRLECLLRRPSDSFSVFFLALWSCRCDLCRPLLTTLPIEMVLLDPTLLDKSFMVRTASILDPFESANRESYLTGCRFSSCKTMLVSVVVSFLTIRLKADRAGARVEHGLDSNPVNFHIHGKYGINHDLPSPFSKREPSLESREAYTRRTRARSDRSEALNAE
jgi:hypothetical protein